MKKIEDYNSVNDKIPKKPEVTSKDNALSILYKFQKLHKYNMFNTRKKINNINAFKHK